MWSHTSMSSESSSTIAMAYLKGPCLDWIEDFLKNSFPRVVVNCEYSEETAVTSEVPQGSVLGAIFFLAFINDMPEHVNSKCQLFADYSITYREVNFTNADCDKLQQDLYSLHEWEILWACLSTPQSAT